MSWMSGVVGAALLSAACGAPPPVVKTDAGEIDAGIPIVDAGSPDAGAPDAGTPPRFEPDALPTGAAIWLKADLTVEKEPRVEVWAKDLSPVLGLAFHLGVDATQLKVDSAGAEPVMGVNARYLQRVRGADVAFGLVRLGAASGTTDLSQPTRIAVLELSTLAAVDSTLTLSRVVARKVDGTFVPVTVAAGRLVLPGGAP